MRPRCFPLALLGILAACSGEPEPEPPADERKAAIAALHRHLRATFTGDADRIAAGYDELVFLAPGHRFLHPEFGLAESGATAGGAEVNRGRYVEGIAAFAGRSDLPSAEEVDAFFKPAVFKAAAAETADGEREIQHPGGDLKFRSKRGDVFVRLHARPEDERFSIYQMRKSDPAWLIVGELQ